MLYSQDFIEQVRDANNIVDIIGQHTQLKGRGHQFTGLCPYPDHNEKSPSFSVSESKQLYHCFGCKKSGNLFTFLETFSGLTFMDAVEFLARRAGIPLPINDSDDKEKTSKSIHYRINKLAAAFFHRTLISLPMTNPVRQYLVNRGITEEAIEVLKLGYAPEAWDSLALFLKQKQVPSAEAERLGLIRARKEKNGHFDLFRDRIIFPIISVQEEVVGFGGRVLKKEQKPKYLNSPESPVFYKGRTFYGLNLTGKNIRQKDTAVIVEGYMDFTALYLAGVDNAVATLGTAMTEDHVRLLKKYTSRIVLMFDGDFAGRQAAERSLITVMQQGLCPLVVFLPDELDPDEYVKKEGSAALQKKIDEAPELFIELLKEWMSDFKFSAHEKIQLMEKLKPILNAISEPSLKTLYVKEVAVRLSVEEKWILSQLQTKEKLTISTPSPSITGAGSAAPVRVDLAKAPKEELFLLGAAVNSLDLLEKIVESGVISEVSHSEVQRLLAYVVDRYRQAPDSFDKLAPLVVSQLKRPEELTGLFKIWSPNGEENESVKATESCIKRVKDRNYKRQSAIIASQLRDNASPEKLEQIMNINKNRMHLNKNVKGEP